MEKQEITIQEQVNIVPVESKEFLMSPTGQAWKEFELSQRMAKMYASSTIVPQQFSGNIGNCIIGIDMARRMGANPLMVFQNLCVVHGQPSFSSKFLIACINASKKFSPLRYEFKGQEGTDDYGCRCVAYEIHDKEHQDPLYGDWITLKMAKDEGWATKNGSKWRTMPGQMLRYRAAAFWQRVYCPEISMGLMTTEEAYDIQDVSYEEVKPSSPKQNAIREALKASQEPKVDKETGELFNE